MSNPDAKYATLEEGQKFLLICFPWMLDSKFEINNKINALSTGAKMHFPAIFSRGKQFIQILSVPSLTQSRKLHSQL